MKALAHRLLQRFGFDIHRFHAGASLEAQLAAMLRSGGFDLVLDVGANAGQYGRRLRKSGFAGRIVSFEPLREAWARLKAASSGDGLWEVADPVALGERDGEIDIHVSANSYSSSALEVLDAHLRTAPDSRTIGRERVALRRLDTVAARYLPPGSVALLKVDTQGYEDRVLAGAAGILPRIGALQLELSLVELYAGQKLLPEMIERVEGLGYELRGAWPALLEPDSGRLLQLDAVFFRVATKSS